MKTKTLLITAAAALAAGIMSSQAQVYSQNVVGYINVGLTPGYNMVANQLDYDGTGTNDNVYTIFGTNLLAGTTVYAWVPSAATYTSANWISSKGTLKWTGDTNGVDAALALGKGVFIQTPATNSLTLVGTVIQGTNVNVLTPGYNLVSAIPPIAGDVQTNLNYTPTVGDTVYVWSPSAQSYANTYNYISSKGTLKWTPSTPQISVGQAFFLNTSGTAWTNTFTAQ